MRTFAVGDVVVDREDDDDARLVVLDPDVGPAAEVVIEDLEATVAAVNDGYPSDDPAVSCVHVDWLDRHVGEDWRSWTNARFRDRLEAFVDEWSVPLASYTYPAGRLRPLESERGQSRLDAW